MESRVDVRSEERRITRRGEAEHYIDLIKVHDRAALVNLICHLLELLDYSEEGRLELQSKLDAIKKIVTPEEG